jgi:hypothetical protein
VTLSAVNAGGTGTAVLTLTMLPPPPVILSALSATGTSGAAFNYQILATNGAASYGASGLPAGLSVNTATGLISGTTTVTGSSSVTITASNAGGTGSASLALVISETPYGAWQSREFPASNIVNMDETGDTADPAGDGIPNLIKYALNLDPLSNGTAGLPVEGMVTTGSGTYLSLTYTQVIAATDITYTVQVSTDLQNWFSGPGYTSTLSVTPNGDGVTESVSVQAATPAGPGNPVEYIRLQVTKP